MPDRILQFSIGSYRWLIDLAQVHSLEHIGRIQFQDTGTPQIGYIHNDGEEIAIFDLSLLLELESSPQAGHRQVILFKAEPNPWGIVVDHARQIVLEDQLKYYPIPNFLQPYCSCFVGVAQLANDLSAVLNPKMLNPDCTGTPECTFQPIEIPTYHTPFGSANLEASLFSFGIPDFISPTRPIRFAIPTCLVLEVIEPANFLHIPGLPEAVTGLFVWQNQLVPLLQFGTMIGIPAVAPTTKQRWVILHHQDQFYSLQTDPTSRFIPSEKKYLILDSTPGFEIPFICGWLQYRDETIGLFNFVEFLQSISVLQATF